MSLIFFFTGLDVAALVASNFSVYFPSVVGVPEILPVDALKLNPSGSPVTLTVIGAVPVIETVCE